MKKTKVAKRIAFKKVSIRKKQTARLSRLLPLFTLACLVLITTIGVFSQPQPNLASSQDPLLLAKNISLVVTLSPTPTTKNQQVSGFIRKAEAAVESQDYCVRAPILFYHHVEPLSEAQKSGHAQFTVDDRMFEQQMSYLKQQGYITMSMDTLVDIIINKKPLSSKAIGLTFDDGYSDAYAHVYPILKKYGYIGNFAIPTGLIGTPGYLNWDQLTEISRDPSMRIYNHTSMHTDLVSNRRMAEDEIASAQNTIQNKLGLRSHIFFYPYGSFDSEIITVLRAKGYVAGLTTLPGTMQCESSLMQLHRIRVGNAPLASYGI